MRSERGVDGELEVGTEAEQQIYKAKGFVRLELNQALRPSDRRSLAWNTIF